MKIIVKYGLSCIKFDADAVTIVARKGNETSKYTAGDLPPVGWAHVVRALRELVKEILKKPFVSCFDDSANPAQQNTKKEHDERGESETDFGITP